MRSQFWPSQQSSFLLGCFLTFLLFACTKQLDVAQCSADSTEVELDVDGDAGNREDIDAGSAFAFPWSTGFEAGLCGYVRPGGFCYHKGEATYEIVTSPVHSGKYAAAFTTHTSEGTQARCLRQGVFPTSAYYSAWFYVASTRIEGFDTINLFHFSANDELATTTRGLWDVSIGKSNGEIRLRVLDLLPKPVSTTLSRDSAVPFDTWFHLVFYLKRASDATGEVALYQNDNVVLHLTGLVTDDSTWGQWLVGSYAPALSSPQTTIYVDDVSLTPDR